MMKNWILAADWQLDKTLMLSWPAPIGDWSPYWPNIQAVFLAIAKALYPKVSICFLASSPEIRQLGWAYCRAHGIDPSLFHWLVFPNQQIWLRDTAPLWFHDENHHFSWKSYRVTGWGGQYPFARDQALNQLLFKNRYPELPSIPLALEGGALASNGHGITITTQFCLQHPGRNQSISWEQLEKQLKHHLGVDLLWSIPADEDISLPGDDTHGHIDNIVHWVDNHTLLIADAPSHHSAYSAIQSLWRRTKQWQQDYPKLKTIAMPLPTIKEQKPCSYLNAIVIANNLLVPQFSLPEDHRALAIYQELYPHHDIFPIDCRTLIQQNGALHCCSHQHASV